MQIPDKEGEKKFEDLGNLGNIGHEWTSKVRPAVEVELPAQ